MSYSSAFLEALLNLCPLKCRNPLVMWPPRMAGWSGQPCHSCYGWKQLCSWERQCEQNPVSLYCRENEEGDHQEMGTWFSQHSLLNFLELQVTPNPSCWSWQNFYRFTRYPPGCLLGDSPHAYCLHSHCVRAGRDVPSYAPMATSSFLLSGENSVLLLSRSQGRVAGACQGNQFSICQ